MNTNVCIVNVTTVMLALVNLRILDCLFGDVKVGDSVVAFSASGGRMLGKITSQFGSGSCLVISCRVSARGRKDVRACRIAVVVGSGQGGSRKRLLSLVRRFPRIAMRQVRWSCFYFSIVCFRWHANVSYLYLQKFDHSLVIVSLGWIFRDY